MSAVDSVTPFARSYIIYFKQLSCQSLFKEFIGREKRLEMHKEAFSGSFSPSVGFFALTVSKSWQANQISASMSAAYP